LLDLLSGHGPSRDAVVIGFKNTDEIDEAIKRMNLALAETA
jgi:hypothetical protein